MRGEVKVTYRATSTNVRPTSESFAEFQIADFDPLQVTEALPERRTCFKPEGMFQGGYDAVIVEKEIRMI
eukprot:509636-Hanusia_phi.AAC.1